MLFYKVYNTTLIIIFIAKKTYIFMYDTVHPQTMPISRHPDIKIEQKHDMKSEQGSFSKTFILMLFPFDKIVQMKPSVNFVLLIRYVIR